MKNYSILDCRHGAFFAQNNDVISMVMRYYGEWAENSFRLMNYFIPSAGVVVDVGANIGALSIPMSKAVGWRGRVYAYEAQRHVFYGLCANILLNDSTHILARNLLIGSESRIVGIPFFSDRSSSERTNIGAQSFLPFIYNELKDSDSVQMTTLDEQLGAESRCDLIKIDVEGAENIVLLGATKVLEKFRPVIYLECGSKALYECLRPLLKELGYNIFWHAAQHFYELNYFKCTNVTGNFGDMNILCIPVEEPLPGDELEEFCLRKCGDWDDLTRSFPGFQF